MWKIRKKGARSGVSYPWHKKPREILGKKRCGRPSGKSKLVGLVTGRSNGRWIFKDLKGGKDKCRVVLQRGH